MSYSGGDTVHPEDLPWLPLAPNIGVRVLRINDATQGYSVMIHAAAGSVLPKHVHLSSSEIYIIKGKGSHPQTGDYREGDYISEPKDAWHDPLLFEEDTTLLMVSTGPSEFHFPDGSKALMDVNMLRGLMAAGSSARR